MLVLVFTQGLWERLLLFSPAVQYVVDGSIAAFILFQFKFNRTAPGGLVFFFLLLIAFLAGLYNGNSVIETFLYMRYFIFTYLIFNQLFEQPITEKQWRIIYKFLIALIVMQGIGAFYTIIILGDRVEGFVGLMSSLGGTTATIFPLFIFSVVFLYFIFQPRIPKKELLLLLVLIFSVLLVGYASGKRTIYFIIPLFILIISFLAFKKAAIRPYLGRKLVRAIGVGLLVFPLVIFGIQNSRGLNYGLSGNESISQIVDNALSYADEYENSTDQYGRTTGRSNTTLRVIDNILNDRQPLVFGMGYGTVKDEQSMLRIGYGYGIVGLTRDLISGGLILCVLTLLLFWIMINKNHSYKTDFTKTLRQVVFLVFVYTYFFYSSDFSVSLKVSSIMVLIIVFVNSPWHAEVLLSVLNRKNLK